MRDSHGPSVDATTTSIWVWMQNRPLDDVIGSADAPFINALGDVCGMALNYSWVGHPTHIHATAGAGSRAVRVHASPCKTGATSIFSVVKAAGLEWRSYEESMPRNCHRDQDAPYVVEHNPALYYADLRVDCPAWDVPMGTTESGRVPRRPRRTTGCRRSRSSRPTTATTPTTATSGPATTGCAAWVPKIVASPGYRARDDRTVHRLRHGR